MKWDWSLPINPSFSLTNAAADGFTIDFGSTNNYRVTSWTYQVSDVSNFSNIVANGTVTEDEPITGLTSLTNYYVRILGSNERGSGSYTASQSVTTNSIPPGNALDFDGVDDNVYFSSFSPTVTSGTIEFWINLDVIPTDNARLISNGPNYNTGDEIYLINNDGRIATSGSLVVGDDLISSTALSIGIWTHVAITADGSGSNLYINGILDDTGGASAFSYNSFRIGGQFTAGFWETVDAQMDEVRVWNYKRTASEIKATMDNPLVGDESGLVAYYNFDNVSGTILYDISPNSNDGNLGGMDDADWVESYALVIPISSDITTFDETSFTFSWTAPETGIVESYYIDVDDNSDFSSPLAGYTLFDAGADTSEDITGLDPNTAYYARVRAYKSSTGEVGTWSEVKSITTTVILTPPGNALDFDGTNDYVNCGNDTSLQISGTAITLEAWINPSLFESASHLGSIICKHTDSDIGYVLRCGGSGIVEFAFGKSPGWGFISSPANALSLNTWSHVAVTYDGTNIKLYVNGLEVNSVDETGSISVNNTHNLYIGNSVYFTDRQFTGEIDEVRIWNTARTAADILENMDNPLVGNEAGLAAYYNFNGITGTVLSDLTTNSNDGTLNNMDDADWVESYALVLPILSDITTFDETSFTFSWTAPETGIVESYYIDVDDTSDFSSPLAGYNLFDAGADTSEVITGLDSGTIYYARVRAYKSSTGQVGAWSEVKLLTTTGTALSIEDNIIKGFNLYPNPTYDSFEISFNSNQQKLIINIYSSIGQLIKTRTFEDSDLIQMKLNQPSGIYFVECINENGDKSISKLIKI